MNEGTMSWISGRPNHVYGSEWFLAKLKNGARAVLKALPKEYSHDYKTADDTYYTAEWVTAWMQLPDSEYVSHLSAQLDQVTAEREDLRVSLVTYKYEANGHISELQQSLALSRAEGAVWREALEKILKYTEISSYGQTQILIWAKAALTSSPAPLLEAVRGAMEALEGGTERGGVFWRENARDALKRALGESE